MAEYINREEVLEVEHRWEGQFVPSATAQLIDMINKIPAADVVERKKGMWKFGKCSLCGGDAPYWLMASTYYPSNFCPNCGADMRGET